jgi:hypothetical protein
VPRWSSERDDLTASEQQVVDDVERVGWHCMQVLPLVDDPPDVYAFSYTVGLEERMGHPELIVVGLPLEVGRGFLDTAVEEIRSGARFEAGEEYDTLSEGAVRVAFREVSLERHLDHLTYADWYYGGTGFRALQLVWPDSAGNLPGDPAYPSGNPDQVLRPAPS